MNLPTNGAPIYVQVQTAFSNGTAVFSGSYMYTEDNVTAAAITSPTPGSTLPGASTTFTWSAGTGGVTGYYLWVGTSPGTDNLVGIGPLSGTSATVNLPTNGAPIYVQVQTAFSNGTAVFSGSYMYTEDNVTAGAITSPTPGSTLPGASTTFTWSAGTGGVTGYYLWVGTSPGTDNLVGIGPLSGTSATVNLPTNGAPIYVQVQTAFSNGTAVFSGSYMYTEDNVTAAAITSPTPGSTLPGASTTFTWSAGTGGVTGYYLWVGTSPGTDNLVGIGPLSGTSATVNLPTNGAPIYVQVQTAFSNGTAVFSGSYMYTEDNVTAAAITSPTPGSTLPGASTTFTWSAGTGGVTGYYLWVGTSPGTDNLVGIGPLSGTSATVNLPTNGAPIYVQVQTAFSNGTAVFSGSYMYTEDNVTAAAITSPTPGSTLPGASTTFTWSAGTGGVTGYYLWVGTSPGTDNLVGIGPLSGTSATVNLPTNGAPIYVQVQTAFSNGTAVFSGSYMYTEDNVTAAAITSPTPGSTLPGASTTFTWSAGTGGVTGYYLWVGTSPGTDNLVGIGPLSGTSATVNLPTNGAPIYVQVQTAFSNGTAVFSGSYTYTEHS